MRLALEFSKKGAAKYISHLDLQRAFSRALRRSGMPVKLSLGFNPHYVVSFASALPLGIESECECVEIALASPVQPRDFLLSVAREMPPGLLVKRAVVLSENAPKLMAALERAAYCAYIETGCFERVVSAVDSIMDSDEVLTVKRRDDKQKSVNIRDMILELSCADGKVDMLLLASQKSTLRPDVVMRAIETRTGRLYADIVRTGLFTETNGVSVPLFTAFAL